MTNNLPERSEDALLDARLKAAFSPPDDVDARVRNALARARGVPAARAPRRRAPRAAAALVIVIALGVVVAQAFGPFGGTRSETEQASASGDVAPTPRIDWLSAYNDLKYELEVAEMPPQACDATTNLAPLLGEAYGSDLEVRFDARQPVRGPLRCEAVPDAAVLGVSQPGAETPVFVIVMRLGADPLPMAPSGSDLQLRRRIVGPLVLYELTPRSEPTCLDRFQPGKGDAAEPSCSPWMADP
ncbi:MAG: hypothetical protein GY711_15505 [bacterium]|nr:hypothetical protein [bacterium]